MQISPKARHELNWWLANLNTFFNTIDNPPQGFTLTSRLTSDTFKSWGASMIQLMVSGARRIRGYSHL